MPSTSRVDLAPVEKILKHPFQDRFEYKWFMAYLVAIPFYVLDILILKWILRQNQINNTKEFTNLSSSLVSLSQ